MQWYESQLAGTVIGAFLGFVFSYVPSAVERFRTRRSLLRLLRAEIFSVTEYLRERIADYRDLLASMQKGGSGELYFSDRRLDEIFFANLVNIVTLDPQTASEILSFYQAVGKYRGLVKALSLTKLEPDEDNSDFCQQLAKVVELMESGIVRGDRLVAGLS